MKKLYTVRVTLSAYVLAENEECAKNYVEDIIASEPPVTSVTEGEILDSWEKEKDWALVYGNVNGKVFTVQEARDSVRT